MRSSVEASTASPIFSEKIRLATRVYQENIPALAWTKMLEAFRDTAVSEGRQRIPSHNTRLPSTRQIQNRIYRACQTTSYEAKKEYAPRQKTAPTVPGAGSDRRTRAVGDVSSIYGYSGKTRFGKPSGVGPRLVSGNRYCELTEEILLVYQRAKKLFSPRPKVVDIALSDRLQ